MGQMETSTSKARILDDLKREQAQWEALLRDIGEDHMTQPGVAGEWSIKDIVAHLTGWRRRTLGRFQAELRHEALPPPFWPPHLQTDDEINAWIYAANRDRPLADVLRESRDVLRQLIETLAAFPEADLLSPGRFPWLEGVPLTGAAFFAHFHEEHEPDMRAWLEKVRRETPGDTWWSSALWPQFGAAIAQLEKALLACPASLWTEHLWPDRPNYPQSLAFPPQFAEFWYVTFHALVWLDLYLSGVPEEEFAPPAPFAQGELDSAEALPERPYTREELHAYLVSLRQTCYTTLATLTDEQARRPIEYPWCEGQPISYLELLLYTMRHVQEHASQMCLFLGQHAIPDADLDAVARVQGDPDSR